MAVRPICPNCRNFISDGNKPLFTKCKAFLYGVPRPYGHNPSPYYPSDSEEPEISIRKHRIFTPIQENDYVYEPIQETGFIFSEGHKHILNITDIYRIFHIHKYIADYSTEEILQKRIFPFFENKEYPIDIPDKEEAINWILSRNQSQAAKDLLEEIFGYEAERQRQKNMSIEEGLALFAMESEPGYIPPEKESLENQTKRMLRVIEQKGLPDDFCIPYESIHYNYYSYILDFLRLNFTVVIEHLEDIDLQNQGIGELPASIGKLKNTQILFLSGNQLKSLPDEIAKLSKLERLDLYGNQLKTLPDSVCALLNLNRLDLYQNQLEALPIEIGNLINLKSLGLNHNQLSVLPDSLANLQTLEGLYCTDNLLTTFTQALCKLKNLKYLYLSRNQLKEIPNEINTLKNLCWLGLAGNQLATLPESISKLDKLEWLDLRDNPISEAEQVRIKGLLPQVEILFH